MELFLDLAHHFRVEHLIHHWRHKFALLDAQAREEVFLEGNDLADFAVPVLKGVQDHLFRNFLGACFHHYDGVFRAHHHQI